MSIVHQFDYFKPKSITEAIDFLSKNNKAAVLAGGTDLVNNIREEIDSPDVVVDIKGLDELNKLTFTDNVLSIGALVSFTDLIESEIILDHFPLIMEISKTVGSVGIRNRATLVGNICSSVPCMDSGPLLRVYDGEITTIVQSGERKIPAEDWFVAPKESAIKPGELVTSVSISLPSEKHAGCFVKLGRYSGEDL
ncbi:FAD binding domain-containing protein, partial [Bacteroidota bacterium]